MKEAMIFQEIIAMSAESTLCAQDKENIQNGDNEMLSKLTYLSIEGYQEMLGIGKRLREAYPELLRSLDDSSCEFVSATGHWVDDSAKAFIYGLTEGKELKITENDSITAVGIFFINCFIVVFMKTLSPSVVLSSSRTKDAGSISKKFIPTAKPTMN